MNSRKYDVAISFSGEDRDKVRKLASALKSSNLHVFFDEWASEDLWGKDLYEYLTSVYRESTLTILVISAAYTKSQWTRAELKSLRNSAAHSTDYTILPVKVDDSEYPSELSSIGYIDLNSTSYEELAQLIKEKLKTAKTSENEKTRYEIKTYHVIPRYSDWAVKRSGASRATAVYKSKIEAINKAKEIVDASDNIKIVIHNSDGTIEKRIPEKVEKGEAK